MLLNIELFSHLWPPSVSCSLPELDGLASEPRIARVSLAGLALAESWGGTAAT